MNTSQTTFTLLSPHDDDVLPSGTLDYFQARHRSLVYEAVLREFTASGISQATLARRLAKRPEVINRLLGAPGNWTLDTVSDLLLAISGGEPEYSVNHPLQEPPRNYDHPVWLHVSNIDARGRPIPTATTLPNPANGALWVTD